ncbi:hypothetical protein ElyMa_006646500 [Elysia marginata]|uniref:Uncharacterized protein n=1 Tax=Elysia marginata TaxID=1093978 RepID=A0AAV4IPI7_9GAST|nr:hypothetical protein ElyMa_006646500 [Elysia marginata]
MFLSMIDISSCFPTRSKENLKKSNTLTEHKGYGGFPEFMPESSPSSPRYQTFKSSLHHPEVCSCRVSITQCSMEYVKPDRQRRPEINLCRKHVIEPTAPPGVPSI